MNVFLEFKRMAAPCRCLAAGMGIVVVALLYSGGVQAEERIYRCGNEYTNTVSEAQLKTCKLISGGNVTVIQAPVRASGPVRSASGALSGTQGGQKIDTNDQRARDADARLILESELRKAEAKQQALVQEYNNGAPEKLGAEQRNNQKYLDRVAELKAAVNRNQSDIDGIRRELERMGAGPGSASTVSAAK